MTIPCGLVARIRRFHRRGRGSIPRKGGKHFFTKKDKGHGITGISPIYTGRAKTVLQKRPHKTSFDFLNVRSRVV